ncbi:uncharacterized protein PITG_02148 [Phytophthora infestans T30-4]|uniref:PH domain-containing protein n=1 Tax=Phytophthora infestans (strain T30-4) TaxID=403677 RepID=D0MVL7_PHYIT|nr:uncharacterized protein PITG_02148 [Phytophthora infestans T30-4]EEY63680.1 conserved hypothetical protein [Phytophthora infestans T30-4]|eukprot:XP_002907116.1 conserved hypothetical protein [Phytophthora infestans T30-4]
MMRIPDLTVEPTPPAPPEIDGYLKKLKRKTRSLAGNWNKRWSSWTRDVENLATRTTERAHREFDDTHFQVESRTRNFFLCGDSKASTACWVTSLEGYRKKLIEYEKDKIAHAAATATVSAKASATAARVCSPQQSPLPAASREDRKVANKKKSRDKPDDDDHPTHDSFSSSSSSSMSSTTSPRSKREKADYSRSDRVLQSEQRSASPLAKNSRSKNRSPPPSPTGEKRTRDRPRDRERGRDRDRDRKFEREHTREPSNDRDRSRDRERSTNGDGD